jgi:hypothetical protein
VSDDTAGTTPLTRAERQARYERKPKSRIVKARYRATTKGILAEERYYQKRKRGDVNGV